MDRSRVLSGYDRIEQADWDEMKYVLLNFGNNMDPDEFKVPKLPDDWVDPDTNTEKGGPTFDKSGQPRQME